MPRLLGKTVALLEACCGPPAFCSIARRSAQASTSGSEALPLLPRQCSQKYFSIPTCGPSSQPTCAGRRADGVTDALRAEYWKQAGRSVSTAACPAPLLPGRLAVSTLPARQPGRLLQHQQQRSAFGLPNLNGDSSKHYQERRLIGCAFAAMLHAAVPPER